jgi:hydroxylamine reductase
MQDLLIYATKGIANYAHRARKLGVKDPDIDKFTIEALFTTVTNVNFDAERIRGLITKAVAVRGKAKSQYEKAAKKAGKPIDTLAGPAVYMPVADLDRLLKQAEEIGIANRLKAKGADITGLQELITYGLKGIAAYADHAQILGKEDDAIYAFIHEALDTLTNDSTSADALIALVLRAGEINIKAMSILDAANTGAYGDPVPTKVRVTPVKGKAIVISGHDLKDLEALLKQTQGTGINVYTHGEMLPTHGYPAFKKYKNFAGNYGGAWQNQITEFAEFPGAILMTTNCLQRPQKAYEKRLFTCGLVGWPGIPHIANRNFKPVIDAALGAEGFKEDAPEKSILIGFGHKTLMSVAGKVIDAVKAGQIKRFFLIGGCDGAKPGRNYFTQFAEAVPKDCVILTLACGKYRFNKLDFGDIGGIPRLIDCGQCNDAYSAVVIAKALAEAFGTDVNGLPLSLIISWYEQKAVAILLALLSLGIRNIRLGPSLPAFVSPNMLKVLVDKFNIMPITTVEQDMKAIMPA